MKNYKILLIGLAILSLAACSRTASVKGKLADAPGRDIVVKVLDVNVQKTIDTLRTGSDGSFKGKFDIKEGDPRFVYLYYNGTKVASMLLSAGDRVSVQADTLGNYSVSGSEECEKLAQVEKDQAEFLAGMTKILEEAGDDIPVSELNRAVSKKFIEYYRTATSFIIANPKSLTVIPVLYSKVNDNLPVFNRIQDAIYFQSAADSLKTVYPESAYVKALEREASRRQNILALDTRMQGATPLSYPDLEMPDIRGEKVKLSEVEGKVVMVMFWSAADAAQKMFNIDSITPIYKEYHKKGFEVYAINIDADKPLWASTVRNQGLEWINVCDGLGAASPALLKYNVSTLPTFYLILNGELWSDPVEGVEGLRNFLRKNL